jgi:hypothetical protein
MNTIVEDESQLLCFRTNHDIMESIEVAFGKTLKQNFILVTKMNKKRRVRIWKNLK